MDIYTKESLSLILNRIAAHYSLTGNKDYDKGFNDAVNKLSGLLQEFEKTKAVNYKKHIGWYTGNDLDQLQKSY
jgi:hypothetical protein